MLTTSSQTLLDNVPKIRVIIRKRPLSQKESAKGETDIVEIKNDTVVVKEIKTKVDLTKYVEEHNYTFDNVFGEAVTNEKIYTETVRSLVYAAFQKAKATCFAYGQTGSGKTFTMLGNVQNGEVRIPGMYLFATSDIFELLKKPEYKGLTVWVSFYDIYCGKLHDLLNDRKQLHAREDGKQNVNIVGLTEKPVLDVQSIMKIIQFGTNQRITGVNSANSDSSRSHAILQISLKLKKKLHGKLSFIDLAGSERAADVSDQNKQTRIDGAEINKSLLALKECIRAIDQDKKHTPFRGSKLTLVLKDSFTGNCKTVMIGNISPNLSSCENTLNTLRYSDRVKELKKPQEKLSHADMLAKQLMLPRQEKNTINKKMRNSDSEDDESEPQNEEISVESEHENIEESIESSDNQIIEEIESNYTNKGSFVGNSTLFKPSDHNQMEELPTNSHLFQQNNFFRSPNENVGARNNGSKVFQNPQNNQISNENFGGSKFQNQQSFKHSASVQGIPKHNFYNQPPNNPKDSNLFPRNNTTQGNLMQANKAYGYGLSNNIEKSRNEHERRANDPELFLLHRQHLDEMTSLLRQELLLNSEVQLNVNVNEIEYQNKLQQILYAKLDALEKFNKVLEDRKAGLLSRQNHREMNNHSLFDLNRAMNDENKDVFLLDNFN